MTAPVVRCNHCGYPSPRPPCARCGDRVTDSDDGREVKPRIGFAVADFCHGFSMMFLAAAWLLLRKEYRGKLWLPVLANLVVLGTVGTGLYLGFESLFDWLVGDGSTMPEWLQSVSGWARLALSLVLTTLSLYFTAPVIIEIALSPFLDPLAEATESAWVGGRMPALDPTIWGGLVIGLRSSAQILILQLAIWIPLLALSFTGIGAILAFFVAGWLNGLVWFDIPCARRGYSLRARIRLIQHNWARALGFGVAFQIGVLIPVFNFLLLTPAAAVAVSVLYLHFDKTGITEDRLACRDRSTAKLFVPGDDAGPSAAPPAPTPTTATTATPPDVPEPRS